MRPTLRQQFRPEKALARPYVGQAVQLQGARMRQVLHAPVVVAQAHEGARQEHTTQRVQLRLGQSGQRQRQRLLAVQLSVADSHTFINRLRPPPSTKSAQHEQQPVGLATNPPPDKLVRVVHLPERSRNAYPTVDRTFAHRTRVSPSPPFGTIHRGLLTYALTPTNNILAGAVAAGYCVSVRQ